MHYYLPLVALLFFPCFSHAQTTQQFMAWSAFLESDCSDTPTYDFMTPMNECLNTSSVSFNPYNLTSPFMKVVQKTGGDQLVGMGCTTSNCDTCKETETIQMKPCMSNSWLGNTTAYFLYLVVDGVVPLSKAGGIIYQYYAPDDTNCSGALMGANIQENGVCTNGMLPITVHYILKIRI